MSDYAESGTAMKVEHLSIQNFKRFSNLDLSFKNSEIDEISNRFLILGDNGYGKTTILQAVALTLALATKQVRTVEDFDWVGFVPARFAQWGRPSIKLRVAFTSEEITATRDVAARWYEAQSSEFQKYNAYIEPGDSPVVTLTLDGATCRASSAEELFQFRGRSYVMALLRTDPSARNLFSRLPGVFWFDQFRNLGSSISPAERHNGEPNVRRESYEFGVARLRRYLNGWMLTQRAGVRQPYDYLQELERLYGLVFPGRSFAGVEVMPGRDAPTSDDFFFLLHDGSRTYDIVEMSGGEQAVFPFLYELVRSHIGHSVVLIDEVDLNLHPPVAQSLISQLSIIGPTNQFLLTTHSTAVTDVISPYDIFRLPGGALCL